MKIHPVIDGYQLEQFRPIFEAVRHDAMNIVATGPAYLVEADNEVVAAFGAIPFNEKAAELWLVGDVCSIHPVTATREARYKIERIFGDYERLQVCINVDDSQTIRWMKLMDFTIEGVLHKYDAQGNDYVMMAIWR